MWPADLEWSKGLLDKPGTPGSLAPKQLEMLLTQTSLSFICKKGLPGNTSAPYLFCCFGCLFCSFGCLVWLHSSTDTWCHWSYRFTSFSYFLIKSLAKNKHLKTMMFVWASSCVTNRSQFVTLILLHLTAAIV